MYAACERIIERHGAAHYRQRGEQNEQRLLHSADGKARKLLFAYHIGNYSQHNGDNNAHAEHRTERVDGVVYLGLENHERHRHHRRAPDALRASAAHIECQKSYARRGIDDRCRRDEFHAVEEREQRKHRYIGAPPNYIFLFH